jgi:hypothetical protein
MCQDLNHLDAMLFVYSKTLIKYESDALNTPIEIKMSNLLENDMFIKKMAKMTKLLNTLFWWENSCISSSFPDNSLFFDLLQKHYDSETDELQVALEEKQKKIVSRDDYIEFLHSLCTQ